MAKANELGFKPGAEYRFEPLRKFRWELLIGGTQDNLKLVLLTCARPQMEFDSTEVHHFNDRFYLAGKPQFSEIEFSMYDAQVDGKFAAVHLEDWRDKVYDPRTNIMLPAEPANGENSYKRDCELVQYDGEGNELMAWSILGAFPRVLNFNDLDYSSSDACMINCTLRIDKAFIARSKSGT